MRLSDTDLQALRDRADIVDVVSQYLPLEKKGKEFVGVCPFHNDHDPSMHVSPDKQIFKCFVCGAGGDVFSFVQKYEKVSFVRAVEKVADAVHYVLPTSFQPTPLSHPYQDVYKVLDQFTSYCRYELSSQDGQQARAYVESRKMSKDILDRFEIGYAPSFQMVSEFLTARFATIHPLEQAGLVRIGTDTLQPVFFDRLIIPIHDPFGHPVGYTARILPQANASQKAKYINTSQTPLYEKGKLIFNYHRAKEVCRQAGRLILCEGAMDVIGLAKAGIQEGIACLGTACTPEQLQLMKQCHVPIVVFYDRDEAGQKAIFHFGQNALKAKLRFSIVASSTTLGKDPDDIFVHHGKEALLQTLDHTISFAEFSLHYLQNVYSLDNYEDKKSFAFQMEQIIRQSLEPFEQPAFLEKLQDLTGFRFEGSAPKEETPSFPSSQNDFPKRKGKTIEKRRLSQGQQEAQQLPKVEKNEDAEKYILWLMVFSQEYVERFAHDVGFFQNSSCSKLGMYIQNAYQTTKDIDVVELYGCLEDETLQALLVSLDQMEDLSSMPEAVYQQAVLKIQEDLLKTQIQELQPRLNTYLKQKPLEGPALDRCLKLMETKRNLVAKQHEVAQSRQHIASNWQQNF